MEYSKQKQQQQNYPKYWNMEYSRNFPKKKVDNKNMQNFEVWNIPWNIPEIFLKIAKQSKY